MAPVRRKLSAAAFVWRPVAGQPHAFEVLCVHPGGPYFADKHTGAWSLPKGEHEEDDRLDEADLIETALRELHEETGLVVETPAVSLGEIRQKSGKRVVAFAFEADGDVPKGHLPPQVRIEWPPKSGFELAFPEVDAVRWLDFQSAREHLNQAQVAFIDRFAALSKDD